MKMFYKMNNCRVLPLYGTLDLVSNDTMPICGRGAMWTMMPMLRMRSSNPDMDAMMAEAESGWKIALISSMSSMGSEAAVRSEYEFTISSI